MPRIGASTHLLALLGYFLLALLVTYPAILHFTTQVPGDLIADRDQNLWNLWWLRQAVTLPTNPFHTGLLYYPYGVDLYYHTLGLPLGLMALGPQLLFGQAAAYNTVLLAGFTLSGYGAFRLGLLVVGKHVPLAAFLGGVVFAFTPYTLDALKGQPEVLSLQWIPLYAEAWIRLWRTHSVRWAAWAGLLLALAALSSLYYAAYLLIFTAAHLLYRAAAGYGERRKSPAEGRRFKLRILTLAVVPAVALALTLPLLIGLLRDSQDPRLEVQASAAHRLAHSADLLSFFAPPQDHPLLGNAVARPGVNEPALHDYLSLGYVALALSVFGAAVARRSVRWFWGGLGVAALLLALGPQLQIGRRLTGVPMPFAFIEWLPGVSQAVAAIAKPERTVVLARLCMGALAGVGAARLMAGMSRRGRGHALLVFAALLAFLLVELPIHPRYIQPIEIPEGFRVLAEQNGGALMELPFATQQSETGGERMLYQTIHGHPIMGGYLARNYRSPIVDSCGPFWSFISARYLPIEGRDIVSPTISSRPLDILSFYKIGYIALYNNYSGPDSAPLDPQEKAAFEDILAHVSHAPPLYTGSYVGIYKVDSVGPQSLRPALLVSDGWYNAEDSGGVPFRWLKEPQGRLCVFSPQPVTASLVMEATAFAKEQPMSVYTGQSGDPQDRLVYSGTVSTAGAVVRTQAVLWQAGMTEVRIVVQGQGVTPQALDPGIKDSRLLTVGLKDVRLEDEGIK